MLIKGLHILVKPDCGQKMCLNEIPKVSFKNIKSLKDYLARFVLPPPNKEERSCKCHEDRNIKLCVVYLIEC